jgi:hypothetical protein
MIEEFTMLFMALSNVTLNDQQDIISWRWTPDGKYTVASVYAYQFRGAISLFPTGIIWKAISKPKCKFFVWLTLHDRVLTAHNMIKRHWPCNPDCPLCLCCYETIVHLLTQCNYLEAVWNLVAQRKHLPSFTIMAQQGGPLGWVGFLYASGSRKDR